MQNSLTINNGKLTLTSMEVAEMVGKEHRNLLRDIRGYIQSLGQNKIEHSKFFVESEYFNSQNKKQPCFEITEKGCELIAHKMTGEKGTIFTALYIDHFHKMKEELQKNSGMVKLTEKQKLGLDILKGGSEALVAYKELVEIETRERTKELRNGHNKLLSATAVINMLNINGLTTTMFFEWLASKGLGIYEKIGEDKKRTFQPNQTFIKYVALEGYCLTGTTLDSQKSTVIFSTSFVDRMLDKHMNELINFVKIKKLCKREGC